MTRHVDETDELDAARQEVDDLRVALDSRHTIGLAQGLLMARYGLTTTQSFELLRRYSQDGNVKLRSLADDVVAHWHETGCRLASFGPRFVDGPSDDGA